MSMNPYWCIAVLSNLSDDLIKKGIVLAEGFSEDADFLPEELEYSVLCRTVARSEKDAHEAVTKALLQDTNVGTPELLYTITTDDAIICRKERKIVSALDGDEVSVKVFFVGYKKDNQKAKGLAFKIIQDVVFKKRWQFWR